TGRPPNHRAALRSRAALANGAERLTRVARAGNHDPVGPTDESGTPRRTRRESRMPWRAHSPCRRCRARPAPLRIRCLSGPHISVELYRRGGGPPPPPPPPNPKETPPRPHTP